MGNRATNASIAIAAAAMLLDLQGWTSSVRETGGKLILLQLLTSILFYHPQLRL